MNTKLLSLAFATTAGLALMSTTARADIIDLGFLMDESGSISSSDYAGAMNALATALANNIPVNDANFQYRIGVVSFGSSADVDVSATLINSQAALDGVVASIQAAASDFANAGSTNYQAGFDALVADFGGLNDSSIVNMMTDGSPNVGDATAGRDGLITAGWDALSFESVGGGASSTLLADLAFDTNGVGGASIIGDATMITNPLTNAFVLEVADFGTAYANAIDMKVQRTVTPTIPLPAGLPLLLSGVAVFGLLRRRKAA